jgi:thiaminase/transcriptional activator TenA
MKLSQHLYDQVKDIWEAYHDHPFIQALGDGSLPIEKFRFYMLQDYAYLYDYVKVFALGIVKTNDPEIMRFFADFVSSTLNGEMSIHKACMARLGVPDEAVKDVRKSLSNLSYTHYMLAVGHDGDVLDILIAILACAWSYQLIGERLAKIPGAADHPFYGEWIRGYASEEYAEGNRRLLDMVDRLGEGVGEARLARLDEIFINCSRYEGMFWDMAWEEAL